MKRIVQVPCCGEEVAAVGVQLSIIVGIQVTVDSEHLVDGRPKVRCSCPTELDLRSPKGRLIDEVFKPTARVGHLVGQVT